MSDHKSRRAVFLDRDGVLNEVVFRGNRPGSPRSLGEFRLSEGSFRPLQLLRTAGFRLFVVSNQPDIARHLLDYETLRTFNEIIQEALPIDEIRVCIHDDGDRCVCRKPQPGMLIDLATRQQIDLAASYVVGDSWKDTGAACAAGCTSVILDRAYNRGDSADFRVPDLAAAADLLIGGKAE